MTTRPEYLKEMWGDDCTAENAALWLILEIADGSNKDIHEIEQVARALLKHAQAKRDYSTDLFAFEAALLAGLIGNRELFEIAARVHAEKRQSGANIGEPIALLILSQMLERQ